MALKRRRRWVLGLGALALALVLAFPPYEVPGPDGTTTTWRWIGSPPSGARRQVQPGSSGVDTSELTGSWGGPASSDGPGLLEAPGARAQGLRAIRTEPVPGRRLYGTWLLTFLAVGGLMVGLLIASMGPLRPEVRPQR